MRSALFLSGLLVLTGCGSQAGEHSTTGASSPAVPGGTLAFSSDRHGDLDIYTMQTDGSGLTRLTSGPGDELEPSWSPDGSKITYASGRFNRQTNRPEEFDIRVMDADGSDAEPILSGCHVCWYPAWSPTAARSRSRAIRGGRWGRTSTSS